jgi:hypothetical protein
MPLIPFEKSEPCVLAGSGHYMKVCAVSSLIAFSRNTQLLRSVPVEDCKPQLEEIRAAAKETFRKMRQSGATLVERGRFCQRLLTQGVWPNQTAVAGGLGESLVQVSRCLKASRVPEEIASVFGDRRLSHRTVMVLDEIAEKIGQSKLQENARRLGVRNDLNIRAILTALSIGDFSADDQGDEIRLVAMKNENYVRLYSPEITKLRRALPQLKKQIELGMTLLSLAR